MKLFKVWQQVAEELNLFWWIAGGTLMALIRHGLQISDDDLDVVVLLTRDEVPYLAELRTVRHTPCTSAPPAFATRL